MNKLTIQNLVKDWQYNPYGSRRHAFAFAWLTGRSLLKSIIVATIRYKRSTYFVEEETDA